MQGGREALFVSGFRLEHREVLASDYLAFGTL